MDQRQIEEVATVFMLEAVQEWGQTEEDRTAAVQRLLDAAGFDAKATCGPVFGGIWPTGCSGAEGTAASAWLQDLTGNLRRGRFQDEVRQIGEAIESRMASVSGPA